MAEHCLRPTPIQNWHEPMPDLDSGFAWAGPAMTRTTVPCVHFCVCLK